MSAFLLVYNLPLGGNSGQLGTREGYAVVENPNSVLAGDRILPDEIRLTIAGRVCCSRDTPLNRASRKTDHIGGYAVIWDPDTMVARNCIFPDEIRLPGTEE